MEFDDKDRAKFERSLRMAMQPRSAPAGLKTRVLARARERRNAQQGRMWMLQRIGVACLLAVVFGGFAAYRQAEERAEERRKGEEARDQVMLALRITHRTLGRVSERLADGSR